MNMIGFLLCMLIFGGIGFLLGYGYPKDEENKDA